MRFVEFPILHIAISRVHKFYDQICLQSKEDWVNIFLKVLFQR